MSTLSTAAVRDNSTLTNFKQWAQIISNFMATAGWLQSGDTGQVNWGTIASVPTAGNYVYEIWEPNDGLTNFFLKIEYGTSSGTIPAIRVSLGTSSNGAGALSGFIAGPFSTFQAPSVSSTVTQWNCYLSGAAGRLCVAMWVNDTANEGGPNFFFVARSKNSSGSNTSDHVTLIMSAGNDNSANWFPTGMQTIVFGTGVVNAVNQGTGFAGAPPSLYTGLSSNLFATTKAPIGPIFAVPGDYENPMIEVACAAAGDITDQAIFTIAAANMPFGASHTFIGFKGHSPARSFPNVGRGITNMALIMLFE